MTYMTDHRQHVEAKGKYLLATMYEDTRVIFCLCEVSKEM
jgi:hypothetical protein